MWRTQTYAKLWIATWQGHDEPLVLSYVLTSRRLEDQKIRTVTLNLSCNQKPPSSSLLTRILLLVEPRQGGASWLDRVGPRLTAMTRRELVGESLTPARRSRRTRWASLDFLYAIICTYQLLVGGFFWEDVCCREQPVVEQQTAFEGQAVAEQPSSKLLAYEQPAADERTVELAATEQRST
ncbi:hypothetical protein E3N88_11988 [Mikania micrantha]|uniref:Uncharacterized protein n=1 Tax=Mikania micrantha TaxID=192012 RepID=A0A5N6P4C7_9ASTR|nr:hypothetical protein E3N88_11988 [Mikania micrantha]